MSGNNPWWAGLKIATDSDTVTVDFSATGLDLSKVNVDSGNFQTSVSGQTITLVKPNWVNASNGGYLGFNGNNVAGLANITAPSCQ